MPSPFLDVSGRVWRAKSSARRLAEQQFYEDRNNAHTARESWKTMRQLMYNDLANVMESEDMVSRCGPTAWGKELFTLGVLNNRLGALSTVPPYIPSGPQHPMPLVGTGISPIAPALPLPALPFAGAGAAALLPPPVVAAPTPTPVPVPVPVPVAPPGMASLVNDIPISVGPDLAGYSIASFLGPVEGVAGPALSFDIAIQRLAAVEMLVTRTAALGGSGVINLRLIHDGVGDVIAAGDAVVAFPFY